MRKHSIAKPQSLELVEPKIRPGVAEMIAKDPSEAFAGIIFYEHTQEELVEFIWAMLSAVEAKDEGVAVQDYCQELKRALFIHTSEFDTAMCEYEKAATGGAA